jgi:hypothetical protein
MSNFFSSFMETVKRNDIKVGITLNILREIKWVTLTAMLVNYQFKQTDSIHEQTAAQFLYCFASSLFIELPLYWYYQLRHQQFSPNPEESRNTAVKQATEQKFMAYMIAANVAIFSYNYAGYYAAGWFEWMGCDVNLANVILASFFTGYAEQGTQYFFIELIDKSTKRYQISKEERPAINDDFSFSYLTKLLLSSFFGIRAAASWYPGAMWNLYFMLLTLVLDITAPVISTGMFWLKLIPVVIAVTASVAISNVSVAMTSEEWAERDNKSYDNFFGSLSKRYERLTTCVSSLFQRVPLFNEVSINREEKKPLLLTIQ